MSKSLAQMLRHQTNFGAGISTGGGDTGFAKIPQEHIYAVLLTGPAATFRDVIIPMGCVITNYLVFPFNGEDDGIPGSFRGVPATGGTVAIDQWTLPAGLRGGGNQVPGGSSAASLLGSTNANAWTKTAVGSPAPITTDQRIRFRVLTDIQPLTLASVNPVTALGNGAVWVGFYAIMPRIRK